MREKQEYPTASIGGQYDTVSKAIIHRNPKDWVELSLGTTDAEVIQVVDTEQPTVKSNRADSFIHVKISGQDAIVHLEMQTHDSHEIPMPYRMAGYIGRAIEFFRLPVYSHVIYLHPRAGRTDPGGYVQETSSYNVNIRYKVIRLYDLDGSRFLDTCVKGLIPFVPLMKPPIGVDEKGWLRQCFKVADSVSQDTVSKADYLTDVAILSGLIYDFTTIRETIMEAIMQESSVIQHFLQQGIDQGIEQGIEQGARNSLIEGILENLEVRFHAPNLQEIKEILERIETLPRLRQLRLTSLQTPSLDAFLKTLNA